MIFVCTGTQVYQFDRLLKELDRLVEAGAVKDRIFAQTGASTYVPKHYEYKPFLSVDEFKEYQAEASLIISHGGTGALIGASKLGKNIIAVPRLAKYGEHTDDHQLQIVEVLEKEGYVRTVYDMKDLGRVISEATEAPITKPYDRESKVLDIIQGYLKGSRSGGGQPIGNYVFINQLRRLCYFVVPSAEKRSKLLKQNKFFYSMGDNVHFQPRHLPADPKFIRFHNNIAVASGVEFITHDIIHRVFNHLPGNKEEYRSHLGCIEIMDNVFIGSGAVIMPDIRIGPNAIVAAGSVVTKDVPPGTVVAGVPARVIGSFDDVLKKRTEESRTIDTNDRLKRVRSEWEKFYAKR